MTDMNLISALGGPTLLSKELGIRSHAVIQWRVCGAIPHKHRPAVLALALQHGIEIDPAEFLGVPGLKIENNQQEGGCANE